MLSPSRSGSPEAASAAYPGSARPGWDAPRGGRAAAPDIAPGTGVARYTAAVAKRGYDRDTIRGGASEWDVSRPFSSYLKLLGRLLVHPFRFFELLPKIPDPRAPALFLAFSGLPAAVAWYLAYGSLPALVALVAPLPLSLVLAVPYHLAAWGGRYGYAVTWRVVAYPLGYLAPFAAVPRLGWFAAFYAGVVLLAVGLATAREIPLGRAFLSSLTIFSALLVAIVAATV